MAKAKPETTPAGFLPDWTDEAAVREFATNALKVPELLADLTPTPIDDQVIELVATIIATDATWDKVWALFEKKLATPGVTWNWATFAAFLQEIIAAVKKLLA